jgi:hypothetical protein
MESDSDPDFGFVDVAEYRLREYRSSQQREPSAHACPQGRRCHEDRTIAALAATLTAVTLAASAQAPAPYETTQVEGIAHQRAKERLAVLQDPYTPLRDRTISKTTSIKLGGTELELHYLGPNHSDSTLIMRLPKERVIFAVDLIPVGSVPGRAMIDSYPIEWEDTLKKVLVMDWDRLIPGHPGAPGGRLGTKQDVAPLLRPPGTGDLIA